MAFGSTAVSLPSLLTTSICHIRSDVGNANTGPSRSVAKLIELAAASDSLLPDCVHVSYQKSTGIHQIYRVQRSGGGGGPCTGDPQMDRAERQAQASMAQLSQGGGGFSEWRVGGGD